MMDFRGKGGVWRKSTFTHLPGCIENSTVECDEIERLPQASKLHPDEGVRANSVRRRARPNSTKKRYDFILAFFSPGKPCRFMLATQSIRLIYPSVAAPTMFPFVAYRCQRYSLFRSR